MDVRVCVRVPIESISICISLGSPESWLHKCVCVFMSCLLAECPVLIQSVAAFGAFSYKSMADICERKRISHRGVHRSYVKKWLRTKTF